LHPIWKIPFHSNKATMCGKVYACARKRGQVLPQLDRADFQYPTIHESPYRITYWIHSELAFDGFIVRMSARTLIMYIENTTWFIHSNSFVFKFPSDAFRGNYTKRRFAYDQVIILYCIHIRLIRIYKMLFIYMEDRERIFAGK